MTARAADHDLVLEFLGRSIRIRSHHPEFCRRIEAIFGPLGGADPSPRPLAAYQVTGRGPFHLKRGGESLYRSERLHYIVEFLETDLLQLLIQDVTDHLLVHGGVVASAGGAVLLPGRAGAGKTTLTAGLVRAGFDNGGDELAVVRLTDAAVRPFPKALNLKAGSIEVLSPFDGPLRPITPDEAADGDRVHHTAVAPDRVLTPAAPIPVRAVVFPRYAAGEEDRLEPVPAPRAIADIAQLSFNHFRIPDRSIACLEQLVGGAACFRLTCSRLDAAVDLISAALAEGSAATAAGA